MFHRITFDIQDTAEELHLRHFYSRKICLEVRTTLHLLEGQRQDQDGVRDRIRAGSRAGSGWFQGLDQEGVSDRISAESETGSGWGQGQH